MSVRFLGRRVYLALAVVLLSARRGGSIASQAKLSNMLAIPARTISRWRTWWADSVPATALWQAHCARFMPPVDTDQLPTSLIARFTGAVAESMMRLLAFLIPLTVRQ